MNATSKLDDYLAAVDRLKPLGDATCKGSIRWYIAWYRKRYPLRRVGFRAAGVLMLALAFLAPFLAKYSKSWEELVAGLITLAAGLSLFFSWKTAWQGYYLAQLNLAHALEMHELKLLEARSETDPDKALQLARQATEELLRDANRIIDEETRGFFAKTSLPKLKLPGK